MSKFKEFINSITWLGGVWSSNDVYFSQQRDQYAADYRPKYPDCSPDDMTINCHHEFSSIAKQRGRYEFIRYYPDECKCRSVYVRTIDELLQVVRGIVE
jgi:hypothetical protein